MINEQVHFFPREQKQKYKSRNRRCDYKQVFQSGVLSVPYDDIQLTSVNFDVLLSI